MFAVADRKGSYKECLLKSIPTRQRLVCYRADTREIYSMYLSGETQPFELADLPTFRLTRQMSLFPYRTKHTQNCEY
jgi:hypothetical protein